MTKNATLRFTDVDATYGLPRGTLDAVWTIESGRGTNRSSSSAGARGHFQFMRDTAIEIGRQSGHDPFSENPEEAAKAAGFYLKQLRGMFGGDIGKALAAYNAGPGRVRTAVRERGENWLAAMPSETRNYVPPTLARLNGSWDYQQAVEDNGGVDPHTAEEREAEETRRRETLRQSGLQQSTIDKMDSKSVMGMLFFVIMIALFSGKGKEMEQNLAAGLSQSSTTPAPSEPSPSTTTGQPAANPPAPAATETPAAATPSPAAGSAQTGQPVPTAPTLAPTSTGLEVTDTAGPNGNAPGRTPVAPRSATPTRTSAITTP